MVSHVRVAEDSFDIVEHFPLQVHFVVKSFHIFALCNLGRLDSQRLFGAWKDSDGVFTTCGRVIPLRKRQNLQTPRLWLLYPRVWRLLVWNRHLLAALILTLRVLLNRYRVRIVGLLARLSVDVLQGELRDVDLLLLQGHRSLLLDYLRALVARLQWITALIKVLVSGLR